MNPDETQKPYDLPNGSGKRREPLHRYLVRCYLFTVPQLLIVGKSKSIVWHGDPCSKVVEVRMCLKSFLEARPFYSFPQSISFDTKRLKNASSENINQEERLQSACSPKFVSPGDCNNFKADLSLMVNTCTKNAFAGLRYPASRLNHSQPPAAHRHMREGMSMLQVRQPYVRLFRNPIEEHHPHLPRWSSKRRGSPS